MQAPSEVPPARLKELSLKLDLAVEEVGASPQRRAGVDTTRLHQPHPYRPSWGGAVTARFGRRESSRHVTLR